MKKMSSLLLTLELAMTALSQNVGIGTTTPINKLQVNGNFMVTEASTATNTPPTVSQTITLTNGNLNIPASDSTGRIYDPGGPSNDYAPNLSSTVSIAGDG